MQGGRWTGWYQYFGWYKRSAAIDWYERQVKQHIICCNDILQGYWITMRHGCLELVSFDDYKWQWNLKKKKISQNLLATIFCKGRLNSLARSILTLLAFRQYDFFWQCIHLNTFIFDTWTVEACPKILTASLERIWWTRWTEELQGAKVQSQILLETYCHS